MYYSQYDMSKRKKKTLNQELSEFQIKVNQFGEITSTMDIVEVNRFLDTTVDDKKFRGIQVLRRSEENLDTEPTDNP